MRALLERETEALKDLPLEIAFDGMRLVVVAGPNTGKDALSAGPELTVGHVEGNDLELSDTSVSRYHCSIEVTAKGFLLRDLESRNGTLLAGQRVVAAYLSPDAVFEVGRSKLRFEVVGARHRDRLAPRVAYGAVVGKSAGMRRIFEILDKLATRDSTILLLGEPGVGKTALAREIHLRSERGPFETVDCASLPSSLIANELLGSEGGAYTSSRGVYQGAFERADGGTLFLDEIGELDHEGQKALLKAIEEKTVKRLGGKKPIVIDVRIIAATNRDLRAAVNARAFRQDLFERIRSFPVHIPPLRDRPEDVPLLVEHFYAQFTETTEPPPAELVDHLKRRSAHLSVRDLRGAVERFVVLGWSELEGDAIGEPRRGEAPSTVAPEDEGTADEDFKKAKERVVDDWERGYLVDLMRRAGGNQSKAARRARLTRDHLHALLKKHGLHVDP